MINIIKNKNFFNIIIKCKINNKEDVIKEPNIPE